MRVFLKLNVEGKRGRPNAGWIYGIGSMWIAGIIGRDVDHTLWRCMIVFMVECKVKIK